MRGFGVFFTVPLFSGKQYELQVAGSTSELMPKVCEREQVPMFSVTKGNTEPTRANNLRSSICRNLFDPGSRGDGVIQKVVIVTTLCSHAHMLIPNVAFPIQERGAVWRRQRQDPNVILISAIRWGRRRQIRSEKHSAKYTPLIRRFELVGATLKPPYYNNLYFQG